MMAKTTPHDPMNPSHPFVRLASQYIEFEKLLQPGDHVLVGVSGGPDSLALLECLFSLRASLSLRDLTVLHFDHGLRGEESAKEKEFVRRVAQNKSLPFVSAEDDVRSFAAREGLSLEMAARTCRHRFFFQSMELLKGDRLALGHNANDQAEEVLLRLCRGTGPSGMAGMLPRSRRGIIRPLLFAQRRDILKFLRELGIPHAQDSSNEQIICQRNALRQRVLPLLEAHLHPQIVRTLERHTTLVREEESFWEQMLCSWFSCFAGRHGESRISVPVKDLQSQHVAFRKRFYRHVVREMTGSCSGIFRVHVEALDRWAMRSHSGRHMVLPNGVVAQKEGETLQFTLEEGFSGATFEAGPEPDVLMHGPGDYEAPALGVKVQLRWYRKGDAGPAWDTREGFHVHMDAQKVVWPLLIRRWQRGDRFKPLGLKGMKKLQDFFVDAKIPRRERPQVPLVCDGGKICWVVGHRLDDRVKVDPCTNEVLSVRVRQAFIEGDLS